MHWENLKDVGLLLLGAMFIYGGYRYAVNPDRIKAEFPNTFAGSPALVVRGIGMTLMLFGVFAIYMFVSYSCVEFGRLSL
jgi:hypothetical protein